MKINPLRNADDYERCPKCKSDWITLAQYVDYRIEIDNVIIEYTAKCKNVTCDFTFEFTHTEKIDCEI